MVSSGEASGLCNESDAELCILLCAGHCSKLLMIDIILEKVHGLWRQTHLDLSLVCCNSGRVTFLSLGFLIYSLTLKGSKRTCCNTGRWQALHGSFDSWSFIDSSCPGCGTPHLSPKHVLILPLWNILPSLCASPRSVTPHPCDGLVILFGRPSLCPVHIHMSVLKVKPCRGQWSALCCSLRAGPGWGQAELNRSWKCCDNSLRDSWR